MTDTPCPQQIELLQYLSGKLDEQQAESLAVHIDTCAICNETVSTLNPGADPLVAELKDAATGSFSAEPECDAAVKALAELPSVSAAKKPADPKSPFALPRTIREYRLIEQIGRGGMGAVFKAEHIRLKRLVAVKVLLGDRLHDDSAVARFDREMEAVGKLDHPNIVRATDAGEDEGTHYLVMELVNGPNLSQVAKSLGRIGVADACELVRQAAEGLQHAHEHGLVHRDIKPSNLILADTRPSPAQSGADSGNNRATVKILDLGLALLRENPTAEGELTSSGQVMGTLDYMAPEQASDTHSVDIRADLYSLGCTLYHLLAGSPPFSGSQYATILKKMMAHANSPVPPLSDIRSDVPPDLLSVLDRLLAKESSERFATPAEVAAALLPLADGSNLPELLNRVAVANADLEHLDTLQQSTVNPISSALSDTINPVAEPDSESPEAVISSNQSAVGAEPFAPTIIVDRKPHSSAVSQGGDSKTRRRLWQSLGGLGSILLLGIVFFIGTGEGRVELTVNHKDIQVSVDGEPQQISVMDGANGEYRIELPNIPAGRRELIVSRDGFSSETKHFWITRNGERAFEMRLAPDVSSTDKRRLIPDQVNVGDATASQRLARWIRNRGGRIFANDEEVTSSNSVDLNVGLIKVELTGQEIDDAAVAEFVRLLPASNAEVELSLHDTSITSDSFSKLSSIRRLRKLDVHGATIDPDDFRNLRLSTLVHLSLWKSWLREKADGQFDLSGVPNLKTLTLGSLRESPSFGFNDQSLLQISTSVPQLEQLVLYQTTITDDGLVHLSSMDGLELIDFGYSEITDTGVEAIVRNHELLTGLKLNGSRITGTAIEHVSRLKKLDSFSISDCPLVTANDLLDLRRLTALAHLVVSSSAFSDANVESLKSLQRLRHLTLKKTKLTDNGLSHLAELRSLQIVDITYSLGVTAKGVAELQIRRPACEVISDFTTDDILAAR